jgi:hypothetical protein
VTRLLPRDLFTRRLVIAAAAQCALAAALILTLRYLGA